MFKDFTNFIKELFKLSIFVYILYFLVVNVDKDIYFYPTFFLVLYIWLSVVHRYEEGPIMYICLKYINGFLTKLFNFIVFLLVYFNMIVGYLNFVEYLGNRFYVLDEIMTFIEYDQALYEIFFYSICWMSLCLTFHLCHRNSIIYSALKRINLSIYHYLRFVIFFRFFSHNMIYFIESPSILFDFSETLFAAIRSREFLYKWLLCVVYYISLRCTLHVNRSIFPKLNRYTARLTSLILRLLLLLLLLLCCIYSVHLYVCIHDLTTMESYLPEYLIVLRNGQVFGQHYSHTGLQVFRLAVHYMNNVDLHGTVNSMRVFNTEVCFLFNKDLVHDTGENTLKIFKLEANSFLSKYFHGSIDAIDVLKTEAHRYVIRGLHGSSAALDVFKAEARR